MRHKWTRAAEHTYTCACGLVKVSAPIPDSARWTVRWTYNGAVRINGKTPPCPPTASDFATDRE